MTNLLKNYLIKMDDWSNEVIKNSSLGKIISYVLNSINCFLGKDKPHPYIHSTLLISIALLLGSLSLPQFANDRFGIGIIILFCFAVFLSSIIFSNSYSVSFNSIDLFIAIFLFISLISVFSSYFLKESIVGFLKYFIFFLSYFVMKITVLNSSSKSFFNLWSLLLLCAVAVSIFGIYQFIIGVEPLATWEDSNYENIHTRVYSTLGNPNLLAGYLLLIFPIGIALPFHLKSSIVNKILFLTGSILILICLIFTGSRGGYIGLIVCGISAVIVLFNYLINRRGLINQTPAAIILCVTLIIFSLALIYLFPHVTERLLTIFTLREHSSNNYRVNVWLACFKMLKDNYLIGIGPGNNTFRLAYGLYMISGFDALSAYNIFLETAIEVGVIGCFALILIFSISFIKLHYLFWENRNILALGFFISLIGMITHGLVDTVFFRPQVYIPFWFLLASIAKLEDRGREN